MRKIKAADAASETFQQDHGYQPTPEELTERCGENVAKMAGRHTYPTSLEEPTDAGLTPTFIDDRATRAQQRLADDLTARAIVNDVARNGTMMEAAILRLRYFEGLGIKEVGNRIGYSEAYVHAILSSLLRRLQAKYMPAV
jgi:DNA-directed RNA polymerase specialized sigma subunit